MQNLAGYSHLQIGIRFVFRKGKGIEVSIIDGGEKVNAVAKDNKFSIAGENSAYIIEEITAICRDFDDVLIGEDYNTVDINKKPRAIILDDDVDDFEIEQNKESRRVSTVELIKIVDQFMVSFVVNVEDTPVSFPTCPFCHWSSLAYKHLANSFTCSQQIATLLRENDRQNIH